MKGLKVSKIKYSARGGHRTGPHGGIYTLGKGGKKHYLGTGDKQHLLKGRERAHHEGEARRLSKSIGARLLDPHDPRARKLAHHRKILRSLSK